MKLKYKVIDNFLPKENFLNIKTTLFGKNFPWYFYPDIAYTNKISKNHMFYMCHVFYATNSNSSFFDLIKTNLLNFIDIKALIRVKANFYPNQSIKKSNDPHIDYNFKHKGAIFSLNTNNGGTILKDGSKIDSIENRILFFDPSQMHDYENCSDQKTRINININYF